MPEKRKITAKQIMTDIRAGMSNVGLMEKYELSAKGLHSIYTKLIEAGALRPGELDGRMPEAEDTVDLENMRKVPRCYPALAVRIHDLDDVTTEYVVGDLTERGVLVVGMIVQIAEEKTFLVEAEALKKGSTASFKAQCRWANVGLKPEDCRAGFDITQIEDDELERLRHIIGHLMFCD